MSKHVRSKVDNLIISNRVHARGEEHFNCPDDLAAALEKKGRVEVLGEGDPARQADYLAGKAREGDTRRDAAETAARKGPGPVENAAQKGK